MENNGLNKIKVMLVEKKNCQMACKGVGKTQQQFQSGVQTNPNPRLKS
jgi:hypothetical protein